MAITIEEQVVIELSVELKNLRRSLDQAKRDTKRATQQITRNFDSVSRSVRRSASAVAALSATVVGVYGTRATKALNTTADTWNLIEARVKLVSESYEELMSKQTRLFSIAQGARVQYEQVGDLYARLARSTKDMIVEDEKRLIITDAISKSLIISGSSTLSSQAALVQLGQAMAADFKSVGQEMASVREQAPRLYQAMVDGMKMTRNEFRTALSEGEVSSAKIIEALSGQYAAIQKEFSEIPQTMSQAMVQLNNAWMKWVGHLDDSIGMTEYVINTLQILAEELSLASGNAGELSSPYIDAFTTLIIYISKWTDEIIFFFARLTYDITALPKVLAKNYLTFKSFMTNVASQIKLAFVLAMEEAKLEVMKGVHWLTSLKIGNKTLIEGAVTAQEIAAQTDKLNTFAVATSFQQATADAAHKQNVEDLNKSYKEQMGYLDAFVEAARKRKDVTIEEREYLMEIDALFREMDKDFNRDEEDKKNDSIKDTNKGLQAQQNILFRITKELEEQAVLAREIAGAKSFTFLDAFVGGDPVEGARQEWKDAQALEAEYTKIAKTDKDRLKIAVQHTKVMERELDYIDEMNERTQYWVDILHDGISDISSAFATDGDVGAAVTNLLENGIDALKSGAAGPMGMVAGYAIDIARGLASNIVSQAEIDAAVGQTEFTDQSLKNLGSVFENAQEPLLEVTHSMYTHIRSMDKNFVAIAKSLGGSTADIDLTGAGYVPTYDAVLGGIWGETTSQLLGSGLQFNETDILAYINASNDSIQGYITELISESSWFGLVEDQSVRKVLSNLPADVRDKFSATFADGYASIMEAAVLLGFDPDATAEALAAVRLSIGDAQGQVSLEGLTSEEIVDRLSDVFSGAFSSLVNGVEGLESLTARYATAGEESFETLTRIAVEYDQASHLFGLIGKQFADGTIIVENTVSTMVSTISDTFATALSTWSFGALFTPFIETIEVFTTTITAQAYTAQMQILDIVESTGGLTAFQDAMGSFMSNFYTDAEQVDFITKSMQTSFATLGITMPKTNAEFRALLETMDTSTEEGAYLYGQVLLLADGFNNMTEAAASLGTSMEDMIQQVADAWLGNLSYLSLAQKAEFASGYLDIASESGGAIDTVEAARLAAEFALKTTATEEEYRPYFLRYIEAIEEQVPEATLDTVVSRLDTLIESVDNQEAAIRLFA